MSAIAIFPTPNNCQILIPQTLVTGLPATLAIAVPTNTCNILRLIMELRSDAAANTDNMTTRLNNDNTANYDYELIQGSDAGITAGGVSGTTQIDIASVCANSLAADRQSPLIIDIYNNKSSALKIFHYLLGMVNNVTPSRLSREMNGTYRVTGEITSFNFSLATGHFMGKTKYQLIGFNV